LQNSLVKTHRMGENKESGRGGVEAPSTALTNHAVKGSEDMADSDSIPGRSPAFQFYPSDFISGTITFTTEEVGAYILLMCACWDKGSIPSDVRLLARIAKLSPTKMKRVWVALASKFQSVDGGYIQPRIEREREKQVAYRRRQSDNAGKRWDSRRNATAMPPHRSGISQTDALQSSSSSSSSSSTTERADAPTLSSRAGKFCEWYADKHDEVFQVGYIGNPQKDYQTAMQLAGTFTDAEMQDAALVWFGMDDDWAKQGTRTIPRFASRATRCVQLARQVPA
jgi:uncharacterized protein YdaU (DUF1376 family)